MRKEFRVKLKRRRVAAGRERIVYAAVRYARCLG